MKFSRRDFLLFSGAGLTSLSKPVKVSGKGSSRLSADQIGPYPESWIELNLNHLDWNLRKIREKVNKPVLGVIKADAYGHGLKEIGCRLDKNGISGLMVCKLQEAVELRQAGVKCPIYNFGPVDSRNTDILIEYRISHFLFSEEAKKLSSIAQKRGKKLNIYIHIDTGMNRMGIPYNQAYSVIRSVSNLKGLHIAGISTTLTEDEEFDRVQIERILSLNKRAKKEGISLGVKHAASSAGIFKSPWYYMDMVRPGIALYGYYPNKKTTKEDSLSLRPVLQFKTKVAAVKELSPGESVSYLKAYTAQKKEKIAVIPVGYSDGYPPAVAGKGLVLIKGQKFPLIASITANHMEVLLHQDSQISPGDEVVLIGTQNNEKITADDIAEWAGISNYKVLIGLNPLIPKLKCPPN